VLKSACPHHHVVRHFTVRCAAGSPVEERRPTADSQQRRPGCGNGGRLLHVYAGTRDKMLAGPCCHRCAVRNKLLHGAKNDTSRHAAHATMLLSQTITTSAEERNRAAFAHNAVHVWGAGERSQTASPHQVRLGDLPPARCAFSVTMGQPQSRGRSRGKGSTTMMRPIDLKPKLCPAPCILHARFRRYAIALVTRLSLAILERRREVRRGERGRQYAADRADVVKGSILRKARGGYTVAQAMRAHHANPDDRVLSLLEPERSWGVQMPIPPSSDAFLQGT
jgi:hypothetical protein